MNFKILYTTALLLISSVSFSQYHYEVSVECNEYESVKRIYSKICKRIDFTNRRIEGDNLFFDSKNQYSQAKMENIVELAGYELTLFKVNPGIVEIAKKKSE